MEKRLTALKIINAAGLMSLVLFAVCWQPGVTVATKGLETETVAQPAERNFSIAATPSKPLAPVTSTLFGTIFF